jgi:hypothetical protein
MSFKDIYAIRFQYVSVRLSNILVNISKSLMFLMWLGAKLLAKKKYLHNLMNCRTRGPWSYAEASA